MIKYKKGKLAILTWVIALIIEALAIMIMIKKKDIVNLFWGIPAFLATILQIIALYQMEIIIDNDRIVMNFGLPFLFKPKAIDWDNIDYVVKDNLFTIEMCRLVSRSPVKPKMMNFSGIKNMNSMIIEIVKRAKYANISPEFQKLVKKDK